MSEPTRPTFEREDLTVTLDVNARNGRLFMAALEASRGVFPPDLDDVAIAVIAVACWLDGPDQTRPEQTFAQQLRRAIPSDAWDQWLPVERDLTTIPAMERALREADTAPEGDVDAEHDPD